MCIYSIVNVENMKLYETSMLDQESKDYVIPTIEDLTLKVERITSRKGKRSTSLPKVPLI